MNSLERDFKLKLNYKLDQLFPKKDRHGHRNPDRSAAIMLCQEAVRLFKESHQQKKLL